MSKYYLMQDMEMCVGCKSCEVSCKTNKNLPPGPALCRLFTFGPVDENGVPKLRFVFMPCFHCEFPWCMSVCPTGAVQKRASDGIVFIDPELCVGCKSCILACPWGACQWNPEAGKAVKCDYCKDRLDKGLKPACVTRCLTQCLEFGEADRLPEDRRKAFAERLAAAGVVA